MNYTNLLPKDIITHIFQFINDVTIKILTRTSRRLLEILIEKSEIKSKNDSSVWLP